MKKFKFIDLFSGIGGFHQAMEQLGGTCVLASDIDKYAIESYKENYNINSDITAVLDIHYAAVLIAISVVLTLVSGLIPSRKAAKQDPVIALRSE